MKTITNFLGFFGVAALSVTLLGPASAQNPGTDFPIKGGGASARPKRPAQATLAAKGAFASVPSSAIKGAMAATNLAGAKKMVGKTVTVVGTVTDVYAPKSGSIVLLNFAKNYKMALVGAIKSSDFAKFPNLKTLKGKKVVLHGPMIIFKGSPEVELTSAGAIRVVK